jgi:hypothetical protein
MSHAVTGVLDLPRPFNDLAGRGKSVSEQLVPIHREAVIPGVLSVLVYEGEVSLGVDPEGLAWAGAARLPSVCGACVPLAEKLPLLPLAEALGELAA